MLVSDRAIAITAVQTLNFTNRPLAQRIEYTHPHFGMVPKPCRRDRLRDVI